MAALTLSTKVLSRRFCFFAPLCKITFFACSDEKASSCSKVVLQERALSLFQFLRNVTDFYTGGWLAAIILMIIAVVAAYFSRETFGKDLNYLEH